MKKIIALLLVAVMCFALSSCFGDEAAEDIAGKWQSLDGNIYEFFADGTVKRGGETLNWWFDKSTKKYCISDGDMTHSFALKLYESRRFFTIEEEHFYAAETFNMVYWGFMSEKVASLTDSKTELIPGKKYVAANGTQFVFEGCEIITRDSVSSFALYFSCVDGIKLGKAEYEATFSKLSSFKLNEFSDKADGDTLCFVGGDLDMEDVKNDKNYFGILSFTVNGSECYVQVQQFFEE